MFKKAEEKSLSASTAIHDELMDRLQKVSVGIESSISQAHPGNEKQILSKAKILKFNLEKNEVSIMYLNNCIFETKYLM